MRRMLTVVLAALMLAGLTASALLADDGAPAAPAAGATLQWTINGNPVGPPVEAPVGANDFHAFWGPRGGAKVQWTVNGNPVGPRFPAPRGANDVEFDWDNATGLFTAGYWTRNNNRIGRIPVPAGANDVHVRLRPPRTFNFAVWTRNGMRIPPPLNIPPGANGFDIKLH
jgi:hypothetical protein